MRRAMLRMGYDMGNVMLAAAWSGKERNVPYLAPICPHESLARQLQFDGEFPTQLEEFEARVRVA